MKSFTIVVATLGLLSFVSSHVIRDEVIPVNLPEVYIPRKIYTGQFPAAQNITPVRDGSRQDDLCSCGQSTATKIVGGTAASEGEFPWRVKLITGTETADGQLIGAGCGATILSPRWLLTAAHCFDIFVPGDQVFVTGGGVTSETMTLSTVAKRFIKHTSYHSPNILANDIALVELAEDLDFSNKKLAPACLPYRLAGQTERRAKIVASGWGKTREDGDHSPSLRKVTLDVIGNRKCQRMHTDKTKNYWQKQHWGQDGRFQDEKILSTHICTYTTYKDTCQGDSGGSIDEKIDGKWYAVGVVSYGHGCAQKDQAGVYSRVSEYTAWIEQTTGISNFCKA